MHILVLHSDVAPDAPPDEQDTIVTAKAVAVALTARGHGAALAPFVPKTDRLRAQAAGFDVVFNLVESVEGQGLLACIAPLLLERLGAAYTGSPAATIALAGDKPMAKRVLRAAGLPTPDWAEPPQWNGIAEDARTIVKSASEDASIGLDDAAVVSGRDAVMARAERSAARYGGRWFAEAYVEGREFNVAVLEEVAGPRVLPVAEMRFTDWPADRPKIVGYAAKWDETSADAERTVRRFGVEKDEPAFGRTLHALALKAWTLFGLKSYARVDFRAGATGEPVILEINPNPCLEPQAGFTAAAAEAGYSYAELVENIAAAAVRK